MCVGKREKILEGRMCAGKGISEKSLACLKRKAKGRKAIHVFFVRTVCVKNIGLIKKKNMSFNEISNLNSILQEKMAY